MTGKRQRLAQFLTRLRFDRLSLRVQPHSLFVFTYHRVLNDIPVDYPFDDGVAEHTAAAFEAQLRWLDRNTHVLSESALLALAEGRRAPRGPLSVITIDDAYVDAYEVVLPILKGLGLPAIFFVPIEPVQGRRMGWWDLVAYALKQCRQDRVRFESLTLEPRKNRQVAIDTVGHWFKTQPASGAHEMIQALADACGVVLPTAETQDNEMVSWDQVRELVQAGMAVGAHTLTHRVLDTLDSQEREEEVAAPKAILETKLGTPIRSIAFPGAGNTPVAKETVQMAADAAYQLAFLPNAGIANVKTISPHGVSRVGAPRSLDELRSLVAYPRLFDRVH